MNDTYSSLSSSPRLAVPELIYNILSFAITTCPSPRSVFLASKVFYEQGRQTLYRSVEISSFDQFLKFLGCEAAEDRDLNTIEDGLDHLHVQFRAGKMNENWKFVKLLTFTESFCLDDSLKVPFQESLYQRLFLQRSTTFSHQSLFTFSNLLPSLQQVIFEGNFPSKRSHHTYFLIDQLFRGYPSLDHQLSIHSLDFPKPPHITIAFQRRHQYKMTDSFMKYVVNLTTHGPRGTRQFLSPFQDVIAHHFHTHFESYELLTTNTSIKHLTLREVPLTEGNFSDDLFNRVLEKLPEVEKVVVKDVLCWDESTPATCVRGFLDANPKYKGILEFESVNV